MITESFQLGDATVSLETGKLARKAQGAVVVRHKSSYLLATVVSAQEASHDDFLPLTVNYQEKMAARGRIPGNFFRRETRPNDYETLICRLIDRSIRPFFPKGFYAATRVDITVYSADVDSDLATMALIGASAALQVSSLPFTEPVVGCRFARKGDDLLAFPSPSVAVDGDMDLVVAAGLDGLVMVEGHANEAEETQLTNLIEFALEALKPVQQAITRLGESASPAKVESSPVMPLEVGPELQERLAHDVAGILDEPSKAKRQKSLKALESELCSGMSTEEAVSVVAALKNTYRNGVRGRISAGRRMDGRGLDTVRSIECEGGLLPACHGSGLFTRGGTQALVSATIGGLREAKDIETLDGLIRERFILHYNFPGFSVGEVSGRPGPGRREVGHGRLARSALKPVLPRKEVFPCTIRLLSDITESDGSSSMATVCGATLALLDAGIPLTAPVAGIAMGLIKKDDAHTIITDIAGEEDHLGDMDFKVAGTQAGITAVQLDNKLGSIPLAILVEAFEKARVARLHILQEMDATIRQCSSEENQKNAHLAWFTISPSRIGQVVGTGGKNLQQLQNRTKTRIEVSREGTVLILGSEGSDIAGAREAIEDISVELKKDGLYLGEITSVREYGFFARIAHHEGLVHVSEIEGNQVPSDAKPGHRLLIKVLGSDDKGRLKLSRKRAQGHSDSEAINA